jgi:Chaperone of endosialidase
MDNSNTAIGLGALLSNTEGGGNTALGSGAGDSQTTGSNNVYIGEGVPGVAGESDACYIASIFGQTSANGIPVLINSNNKLGTTKSSARFKRDIHDMDKASEAVFALRPVAFRYNDEIDPGGTSQFGLVAEEVENVNADLVVRDKEALHRALRAGERHVAQRVH